MSKPTLYVLIGVPASGKSTIAKKLSEKHNADIFSSDDIREEWFGDANKQFDERFVEKELPEAIAKKNEKRKKKYENPNPLSDSDIERIKTTICNKKHLAELNSRITNCLKNGKNAIYDATNISIANRRNIINTYRNMATLVGVDIKVDKETAKQRNQNRTRKVPDFIIDSMFDRYQQPTTEEGFYEIIEY